MTARLMFFGPLSEGHGVFAFKQDISFYNLQSSSSQNYANHMNFLTFFSLNNLLI